MSTTIHQRTGKPWRPLTMLLGTLLLAGCAGGSHVGEAWQCPLAQGVACQSVSEADPAVAPSGGARKNSLPSPLRRAKPLVTEDPGALCAGGCGLLAWFAELFSPDEEHDEGAATAEPLSALPEKEPSGATNENLRTKERIARIWIAPFVDAEGVYREAGWVRVVVEPARWRLP